MSEKIDVLGREDFIQKMVRVVELISDSKQGCCFGVNGTWGSGKSFVLEKFEKQLKEIQLEETADNRYFVFHYDCWKYDYYDEPAIAIISAMLDVANTELNLLPAEVNDVLKLSWETVANTLFEIARQLCINKISMDLVAVAEKTVAEHDDTEIDDFDILYGFKRALEATRDKIQTIAESKTVVIVVDELDRCLPTYSIKVLERLHHIFDDIENVIVIISMDKSQMEHSIKGIFGEKTNVDAYLRKFISFKVDLDNGIARQYIQKYDSYTSMFEINIEEEGRIETFFAAIMTGMDMRTQERIFRKAEIIHKMIVDEEIKDSSIMTFEVLFLTVALRAKTTKLHWLVENSHFVNFEEILGKEYYDMLRYYEGLGKGNVVYNGHFQCIQDDLIGKTFFWIANIYDKYSNGVCKPYYYDKQAEKRVAMVRKFAELIEIIDID